MFLVFQEPLASLSAVSALLIFTIPVSAQRAVVHENDIVNAIVNQFEALSRNSTACLKEDSSARGLIPVHCSV
jgi:hypothetical protein